MNNLTENQQDFMYEANNYVGETKDVLCGEPSRNVNPEFVARCIGGHYVRVQMLKGLEKKGYIKINDTFWKGANIDILKRAD